VFGCGRSGKTMINDRRGFCCEDERGPVCVILDELVCGRRDKSVTGEK
jgi:hypothetical protein